ncbi:phenylalanine--tRNA ligase subunit alpha [Chloroflexia bacterium SDU3-3]|nr:phenylalanine--tRNA ligase subunit alpha [Chloroflexia bacterium SDU3-3]
MSDDLKALQERALGALAAANDAAALAEWKTSFLGKKGELSQLSRGLGALTPEERPAAGQAFNAVRQALEAAMDETEQRVKQAARASDFAQDEVDVTLPGRSPSVGRIHPINQTIREIIDIFGDMGFQVWESPEIETDEVNYGLLNFPPEHPARDMQDTFYVDTPPDAEKLVLRTHTSGGQIHAMRRFAPEPVRVLLPGKVYRNEQVSARSEMQFSQFEFLAVGKGITLADLKGTLGAMAERLFGEGTKVRLRPSYFPFTEPSAEMDVTCFLCGGKGCRICKHSGWLEIGGCGMVHPNVLRNGGYDPAVYSGFAGGFGPERISLLKYGIDDIRWFLSGDERLIQQFG